MRTIRTVAGMLLGGLFCLTTQAATQAKDVTQFTLKNGMTMLVLEDHSIPNANMYLFWKVGSRNEHPGITGLSHFFEHMMFNGSKKYGPKMFDRTMEAAGGSNNAYTTNDVTVYTDWFPSDALETIFDLEADRIQYLDIDPDMVESERGVVASERSTGLENSNFRAIYEEVLNAAFRAHPYSWPVIGHESDIANWSMDDLRSYHQTYYAPNNAVVVVVGDVKTVEVKKLAQTYFEPIPAQTPPRPIHTVEPEQKGERRAYLQKASVTSPNILMAFHVPAATDPDYYPLVLLSDILSNGNSSRLQSSLVFEQQLATDVFTDMSPSLDPYLFFVYATAAPEVTAEALEQGMIAQINAVMEKGVSADELQKVKNQRQVNFYRELATINGKANALGDYATFFGDYTKMFGAAAEYDKVSLDDIKRVANTYLRRANRTVGVLDATEDSHENDR